MRLLDIPISVLARFDRLPFGVASFAVTGGIALGLACGCQGGKRGLDMVAETAEFDGGAKIEVHAADAESAKRVLGFVTESARRITARLEVGMPDTPLTVYAVSSRSEKLRLLGQFSRRLRRLDGGCFVSGDRFVVVAGGQLDEGYDRYLLAHELVHYVLVDAVRPLDPWLDEGLAVYLGLELEPAAKTAKRYSTHVRRALRSSENEWVIRILKHRLGQPITTDREYALAWAFLRFLVEGRPDGRDRMTALLSRLQEGADELDALQAEFELDMSAVDAAFRQWARKNYP